MAPSHDKSMPRISGVFDMDVEALQLPELSDGGNANSVQQISHAAGSVAIVGQCLEPWVAGKAEIVSDPSTVLRGSSLRVDAREGSFTALTDLSGQWPLYYSKRGNQIQYSSDAEELAETVGAQVDPIALAYFIIGGEFIDPGRTVYANVDRLPAGHMLCASRTGLSVEEYAALAPDTSVGLQETAEDLHSRLVEAVAFWPEDDGEQYYSFSGGYDSTSLAFLGASMLSPSARLQAFHTQRIASLSGDTAYATSFATLNPQIDLTHVVVPDEILPYNDLASAQMQYPFSQVEGVVKQTVDYELGRIAELGASVQVMGEGGDALFAAPPQYMADLLSHPMKNALRIVNEGTLLAHEGEIAFTGLLKATRGQSGFTHAGALKTIAAAIERGEADGQLTWHRVTAEAVPLLTNHMRQQLAGLTYDLSQRALVKPTVGIADYIALNDLRLSGRFTANLRRSADRYDIATRAPFLDDPVVAARFRLQTHLTADPVQFKALLRASLGQEVPVEVFERTGKGSYSREAYQGIRTNAHTLRALFNKGCMLADLGVVEPAAFQQLIANAEMGQAVPLDALERAVSAELWLRQHYGGIIPRQVSAHSERNAVQIDRTPVTLPESMSDVVRVPPHIMMAETEIGIAAFNLKTSVVRNMHIKAALVVRALQQRGKPQDAADAFRARYPDVDAALLSQDLTEILTNLITNDVIEAGSFEPFTIRPAAQRSNDAAGEVRMIRGDIDTSGVRLRDYIRMGRALLRAIRLDKQKSLYEVLEVLGEAKDDLPPADTESVRKHLVAGHVLARFSLFKAVVCSNLAAATVLAEAKRGRAADYILAMVPDPNYYHAAPGVQGRPVQTPQDRIMDDNFTILGVF